LSEYKSEKVVHVRCRNEKSKKAVVKKV